MSCPIFLVYVHMLHKLLPFSFAKWQSTAFQQHDQLFPFHVGLHSIFIPYPAVPPTVTGLHILIASSFSNMIKQTLF